MLPPRSRLGLNVSLFPQADACGYMLPPHSRLGLDVSLFHKLTHVAICCRRIRGWD